MNKLVSIIIPRLAGRRDDYFKQAVKSVEDQTYPNIELIIAESDKSEAENIKDGLEQSKGKIIHILHDDDWLPVYSVDIAIDHMRGYDFIHGQAWLSNGQIYSPPETITIADELKRTHLHNATMYYRRDMFDIPYIWEVDFHIHNLARGKKLGYCPFVLANYRLHKGQLGLNPERKRWKREIRQKLIEQYG